MRKAKYILYALFTVTTIALSGCGKKNKDEATTVKENVVTEAETEATSEAETEAEVAVSNPVDVSGRPDYINNGLPVIYIDIDESKGTIEAMNSDIEHKTRCYGSVTIAVPDNYSCKITGSENYKGGVYQLDYIRGRGNTTWQAYKKPYKIKLSEKNDLFGMGKSKNYALMSNPYDPTGLRNRVTNEVAANIGIDYSIQSINVDVVMNGKYLGSYVLSESIEVGEGRIDIDNLEKDYTDDCSDVTLSGGYVLGKSFIDDESGSFFETERCSRFNIDTPEVSKDEDYEKAVDYIKNHVQKTENSIFAIVSGDASAGNYADYIDVDSAIKYYWLQEFSLNSDAYITDSTVLYKKRDTVDANGAVVTGKIYYGPAWDFDLAYNDSNVEKWYVYDEWIRTLMLDKSFADKMIGYWPTVKAEFEAYAKDGGLIDSYSEENRASALASEKINEEESIYDDSIKEYKAWIKARIEWIDNNIESLRGEPLTVHFMYKGKEIYTGKGVVNAIFTDVPKEAPDGTKLSECAWKFKAVNPDTGEEEEQYFSANGVYNTILTGTPGTGYELTVEAVLE